MPSDDVFSPIERKLSLAAGDILEGTVGYGSNAIVQQEIGEYLLSDLLFRVVGFK